jgi:heme exporter protein C
MTGSTSSRGTRVLGALTLAGMAALLLFALVLSPEDEVQGEAVRMLYVHVPTAIVAFTAFFVSVVGSIVFLWKRSEWWDITAHASAEIGAVLLGATLVSGMLWGRVSWGVYWTWDARLTTTALLFVFVLGYLAVRRLPLERDRRSRLAAVVGLLLGPTTIVCHYATTWWRTLHQGPTISRLDPQIDGLMLFTLMLGMVVFAFLYAWLLIHRFRVLWLEHRVEDLGLDAALAERRQEAEDGGTLVGSP